MAVNNMYYYSGPDLPKLNPTLNSEFIKATKVAVVRKVDDVTLELQNQHVLKWLYMRQ